MDPRKAIFDEARKANGGRLSSDDVVILDNALDRIGIPTGMQMADPFEYALSVILKHEGGYVDHPKDPGGRTNLGVTQATWEAWTGRKATEADMRALTPALVAPLYRKRYWEAAGCDKIAPGLGLCLFDFSVNAGVSRGVRYLQKLVGVSQDGVTGPNTQAATAAFVKANGEKNAISMYSDFRRTYYKSLSTFATFGKGWLRRVDETEDMAKALVK